MDKYVTKFKRHSKGFTNFIENTLTIKFNQVGIKYAGTFNSSNITFTFYQGGMELLLNLIKTVKTLLKNTAFLSSDEELKN